MVQFVRLISYFYFFSLFDKYLLVLKIGFLDISSALMSNLENSVQGNKDDVIHVYEQPMNNNSRMTYVSKDANRHGSS